ncbi:MAG: bifunctional riboflavin kinase/FAD synthetase [Bacteroidales bacterium]|nr:bifunctional riboflavin kinase/FAD synthetase [Bacteroidales bacterium]MDZ4205362.1 bifunctional riboflavin kinase/FAD synthetase [Bacteroidales bacterium]
MNVYEGLNFPLQLKKTVVSVGAFDGVHVGHKTLIKRMKEVGTQYSCKTLLVTFHLPPRFVLNKQSEFKLLNTTEEKIAMLEEAGIEDLWVLPFTREFAELSYTRFVEEYLSGRAGVGHLVIGYDHSFGKGKGGVYDDLLKLSHELGFSVERFPALTIDGKIVGSSIIRELLLSGNIVQANLLLGYNYCLSGKVVRGNQIGKLIGFPTANLELRDPNKLIPSKGVYACLIGWKGNTFFGMSNIGIRPTIESNCLTIEANIFNFNREIYNDEITLRLVQKIRDEKKFGNLELLKKQLFIDKKVVEEILENQIS